MQAQDLQILDTQIKNQIIGKYSLDMMYSDIEGDERLSLFKTDNAYYLKPVFCAAKEISAEEFNEILSLAEDSEIEEVRVSKAKTEMRYDDFFNKYYNGRA